MEIVVQGKGSKLYTPDEVEINLTFEERSNDYEDVLQKGNYNFKEFKERVLKSMGFSENDLKTQNITIQEEKQYNNETSSYDFIGYLYQNNALLKFPYEQKLDLFFQLLSTLQNPPHFNITFGFTSESKFHEELLQLAFADALMKAEVLAQANKKVIKDCLKITYPDQDNSFQSMTNFNDKSIMYSKSTDYQTLITIYPMDVLMTDTINCLFIAE